MIEAPLISIVIPVFNGANYLRQAIDSALAQTYPQIEVLVVNDGSTDNGATAAVARSYGQRIRYLEKDNGGVASALNLGIREMRGQYFSWLSHDDVYLPHKLSAQWDFLAARPELQERVVLYSDYEEIDATSRPLGLVRVGSIPPARLRVELIRRFPVHGCTTLLPRRILAESGGFDESLRTTQDYHLWFRIADRFEFHHLPEVLIQSRRHPDQGCLHVRNWDEVENLYLWMVGELDEHELTAACPPASLAAGFLELAVALRTEKMCRRAARAALLRCHAAVRREPLAARLQLRARIAAAMLTARWNASRRVAANLLWIRRIRRGSTASLPAVIGEASWPRESEGA